MRSITRATIVFFVASGLFAALSVALHLFGPRASDVLGETTGTVLVVLAWVTTLASVLLLYHGMMRAASEQDAAEARRVQALHEWQAREQPGPPVTHP